jgi:hypothetical protein
VAIGKSGEQKTTPAIDDFIVIEFHGGIAQRNDSLPAHKYGMRVCPRTGRQPITQPNSGIVKKNCFQRDPKN